MFTKKTRIIVIFFIMIISCSKPVKKSLPNWINEYKHNVDLEQKKLGQEKQVFEKNGLNFRIGKGEVFTDVWARGLESKGVYPLELLPALFNRKIIFDELELKGGKLLWVFTGSKAGFTVEISQKKVRLYQRFYDSFGFNKTAIEKNQTFPTYPQEEFVSAEINYSGELKSISISYDSNLKLKLYLNNKLVATQMCIFDVTRHQLRYTSTEGIVAGKVVKPVFKTSTVTINSEKSYQKIIGFGGITSVVAYNELSEQGKKDWWKFLQDYNLLIQREYPNGNHLKEDCSNFDNLDDASVHYYGDNFPNGEISDFNYNKKIFDLGGMVIFEFWGLPPWASKVEKDSNGNSHQIPIIDKYVHAVVKYCEISKKKTGHAPQIVGIQNERKQPPELWQQMTLALRKGLNENGFENVKIHMHNASELSMGIDAAKDLQQNNKVWNTIDFAATNMYDYQRPFIKTDSFDDTMKKWKQVVGKKPFLSTELCINNGKFQHDSYHLALAMGMLYHKNLVIMDASAIMYCWLLLNGPQPTFDATRSLFKVDRENNITPVPSSNQLRVFGAFSRHLLKGMKRVEVNNKNKDIFISAYQNQNQKTVIILNRSSRTQKIKLEWQGSAFNHCEITDTYSQNVEVPISEIVNRNNSIIIKGGQIITLYQL